MHEALKLLFVAGVTSALTVLALVVYGKITDNSAYGPSIEEGERRLKMEDAIESKRQTVGSLTRVDKVWLTSLAFTVVSTLAWMLCRGQWKDGMEIEFKESMAQLKED